MPINKPRLCKQQLDVGLCVWHNQSCLHRNHSLLYIKVSGSSNGSSSRETSVFTEAVCCCCCCFQTGKNCWISKEFNVASSFSFLDIILHGCDARAEFKAIQMEICVCLNPKQPHGMSISIEELPSSNCLHNECFLGVLLTAAMGMTVT